MRLWSVHPRYLDRQGLTACWREALLAQKVLAGGTKGYTHHPQLQRFRDQPDPSAAIGCYLTGIADEAATRGYHFDRTKIGYSPPEDYGRHDTGTADAGTHVAVTEVPRIAVPQGQVAYEWEHLLAKLTRRSPQWLEQWAEVWAQEMAQQGTEPGIQQGDAAGLPQVHPLFFMMPGGVAPWEVRTT